MPKLKTCKTAAKRFKISATGKIMRRKSHNNHMFFHKSGSQKRALDVEAVLSSTEAKRVNRMLAIGHPKKKGEEFTPEMTEAKIARRKLAL